MKTIKIIHVYERRKLTDTQKFMLWLGWIVIICVCVISWTVMVEGKSTKDTSCSLFLGDGHSEVKVFLTSEVKSKTALYIFARKTQRALNKFEFFKVYNIDYYIEKTKGACKGNWNDVEISIGDYFPSNFKNEVNLGGAPGYGNTTGFIFVPLNFKWREEAMVIHEFGHAFNLDHYPGPGNIMSERGRGSDFNAEQYSIMKEFIEHGR